MYLLNLYYPVHHNTMECVLFLDTNTFTSNSTRRTLTALNGAICGCIVIFNLLAVWGIVRTKLKKKPLTATRKLLLILFIFCVMAGVVLLPFQIYMIQRGTGCPNMIGHVFTTNFFILLLNHMIVLLVMERHVLIVHRRKHRKDYSGRQLRLYVTIAVIIAVVSSLVQALLNNQSKDQRTLAVFYIVEVTYIIILLLFVMVNTLKIAKMVSVVSRQTSSLNLHNKSTERRLSKAVILIAVIFVLCQIPLIFGMIYLAHHHLGGDNKDVDGGDGSNLRTSLQLVQHGHKNRSEQLLLSRQIFVWCILPFFASCFLASIVYMAFDRKIRMFYSHNNKSNSSQPQLRKLSQQKIYNNNNNKQNKPLSPQQKVMSKDNKLSPFNSFDIVDGGIDNNNTLTSIGRINSGSSMTTTKTPGRKISEPSRKISKTASFKDMKKKVSVASATMEIRNGVLVLKQDEKRSRKISKQATINPCYDDKE